MYFSCLEKSLLKKLLKFYLFGFIHTYTHSVHVFFEKKRERKNGDDDENINEAYQNTRCEISCQNNDEEIKKEVKEFEKKTKSYFMIFFFISLESLIEENIKRS